MYKKYPDSTYSRSNVLGKKPIIVLIHKGIESEFLYSWYRENPEIHRCLMSLPGRGYSVTFIPWDGDGDLINQINEKKRRCVLIFQDGEIKADMSIERLELLCNNQGWLLIQNDRIMNNKPSIKKDITSTHINMLVYNQLKEFNISKTHDSWHLFSKSPSHNYVEKPRH